jgi:GT2 family glycosyltransferase
VELIHKEFPQVRVIENGANLRFSKGNNVGIRVSTGELILILNPDTIIHEGALDKLVEFAGRHPEAGAFGCRVQYADGTYQSSARLFPTIWRDLVGAFYLWPLAYFSEFFNSDEYIRWKGDSERQIEWQSGCCVMVRAELLKRLGGFDEQFFYYYEDVDLCRRVWDSGYPILYTPEPTITHLVGQSSTKRFPVPFELDKYRNRYRYYYKYFGKNGVRRCRRVVLASLRLRQFGYGLMGLLKSSGRLKDQLALFRVTARWNKRLDPVRLVENGEEPELDLGAMASTLRSPIVPPTGGVADIHGNKS